ncbi:MAG: class I SAM-dependent methyltransferase [Acidimicrobiales bacterium]|jgi:SAM-dependent methyltransferase
MDAATVAVYERVAVTWKERRGDTTDGLGRQFRQRVGAGLVADLGCGAGRYLGELDGPVLGVDATAAMLTLARPRGCPLLQGDLEALPLADGTVAGAFARHSYLHLPKARLPGALGEAKRVLRAGGWLMVTLIAGSYEGYELPDDDFPGRYFACWTSPELSSVLAAAGFSEVRVTTVDRRHGAQDLLATARC